MVLQLRPAPTWFTQNIVYTSLHPVPSVGRPKEEQLRCLSALYTFPIYQHTMYSTSLCTSLNN